jgi:hypothetical protein
MIGRKALKQLLIGLMSGILILSACRQVPAGDKPTSSETPIVMQNVTATPSQLPTRTNTSLPTTTPTESITPLSTIPIFTPTFDTSAIVTVTPAPKAECPQVNTSFKPEEYFPETLNYSSFSSSADKILEFLNNGGSGQLLVERLKKVYPKVEYTGGYDFFDVTGDQVPEFLFIEFYFEGKLLIFSCKDGTFEQIAALSGDHADHTYSMEIEDLNLDGMAEVILIGAFCGSFCHFSIYLYEWSGQNFTIVTKTKISPMRQILIKDFDGNGTKEIMLIGDDPSCLSCKSYIPRRQRTIKYGWNGKGFVEVSNEFEFPEYRFQAIQDADAMAIIGRYDKAVQLYEETISNKKLEWWSSERLEYERALSDSWIPDLTLPPEPSEDEAEYPRLAAYAYYRIMLLHIVQEDEQEAGLAYDILQRKFGKDKSAKSYVEMATEFWDAYESTHRIYDGCASAIQYATKHPEILIPLGSEYHGWQSHTYVPADVCPFR